MNRHPRSTLSATSAARALLLCAGSIRCGSAVVVTSGDGLQLDFGAGPTVDGVLVDGTDVSPPPSGDPGSRFTGFVVTDFLNPVSGGVGPNAVHNGDCSAAGVTVGAAAGWSNVTSGYTRVSNESRQPGGFALLVSSGHGGGGATTRVAFNTSASPAPTLLVLSGWSMAASVTGVVDTDYSVYCDLEYVDGTHLYGQTAQFQPGTTGWQHSQTLIELSKPVKAASVYVLLRGDHKGQAYFTDILLATVEPAVLAEGSAESQPDGTVLVRATRGAPTSIAVEATFEGLPTSIRINGTIHRTDNQPLTDRAISLTFSLPINATGWHFADGLDSDFILGGTDSAIGSQYQNPELPFPTDIYPFFALTNPDVGLAIGVPVDGPIFVSRAKYTGCQQTLSITADVALTSKSSRFGSKHMHHLLAFRRSGFLLVASRCCHPDAQTLSVPHARAHAVFRTSRRCKLFVCPFQGGHPKVGVPLST
eukprot:m.254741 g.254741  ORF g.254741 m.254741 type:complete len:477 (-) comp26542_c1_seq2:1803-3233(-)